MRKLNYATIYVVVLVMLALACSALTPTRNLVAPCGWGLMLTGAPIAIAGALLAAWLDPQILQHIIKIRAAGAANQHNASPIYYSGDASVQQPVWVTRAKVARSVQNMPLWQLLVIALGEEIGFRVGVPLISQRETPSWFLLTTLGGALFAYGHSVFGRGQILAKIPLAVLGTILFIFWGLWACILGHVIYNFRYWWGRSGHRRNNSATYR